MNVVDLAVEVLVGVMGVTEVVETVISLTVQVISPVEGAVLWSEQVEVPVAEV